MWRAAANPRKATTVSGLPTRSGSGHAGNLPVSVVLATFVESSRMKTVALVGKCARHYKLAPFDDRAVDIWALNEMMSTGMIPRADAMFEIHKPGDQVNSDPNYLNWLHKKHEFPIYMNGEYPDVPSCVVYPLGEVRDRFFRNLYRGDEHIRHFATSTPAHMIALALLKGYERIELYGIEVAVGERVQEERDSTFFWMGVALGMGATLVVPKNSMLFDVPLYGYES